MLNSQMKAEMEREKTSAFDELKSSMEASHRAEIVLLLEKKKKENEEDLEKIKLDQVSYLCPLLLRRW